MGVSCIIPAWNEAARLPPVLASVVGHPLVAEVIVVDDASADPTAEVAARAGARVIALPRNGGKSAAVAQGLAAARGGLVLLLDADLQGLTPDHVAALILPVMSGRAAVSVSLRSNAPLLWRLIGLDYISGERVMPREVLAADIDRIAALRGFGLEVRINRLWLQRDFRVAVVPLSGVSSPSKARKHGVLKGLSGDVRMIADILRTVGLTEVLRQIRGLRRARAPVTKLSPNLCGTVTQDR